MKKVFLVLVAAVSLFLGVKTTNAMTEAELKEILTKTYTINGGKFKVKESFAGYIDSYLNAYDVKSADADYIAARVDEAINIIKASGKSKVEDLSAAKKNELKALVEKVSVNTEVKATVQGDTLVVYKPEGGVFAKVDDPIKQTGSESNTLTVIATLSFLITVAGACLVVRQVKSSN